MLRQAQHERVWGIHNLVPHTDAPARAVGSVSVEVRSTSRHTLGLTYSVRPAATLRLPEHESGHISGHISGLWQSTCFELFVKANGETAYNEFNFAPFDGWAAYSFSDRRSDMMAIKLDRPPVIIDGRLDSYHPAYPAMYQLKVMIDRDSWPRGDTVLGLSAVIEETDGTKSYWALRHPPGKPDFHHPDCFALELPAVG